MHRRCRTWLDRCILGASSSFKRLLKTPRRYRTAIYWSISNRTRPRTCVCARPSFQTTVFSTCTCRRYKKTARVDSIFIRTMSELVKRHIVCIQALDRIKSNKLKRAIIANADADLLCALAECAYNILKKNIPLSELQRRRLSKCRTKLGELAQRRTPAARRRRILLQQQVGEGQSVVNVSEPIGYRGTVNSANREGSQQRRDAVTDYARLHDVRVDVDGIEPAIGLAL